MDTPICSTECTLFQITQDKNKEEAGGEARWEKEKDWAEDDRVSAEKRTELWSILEFCAL